MSYKIEKDKTLLCHQILLIQIKIIRKKKVKLILLLKKDASLSSNPSHLIPALQPLTQ